MTVSPDDYQRELLNPGHQRQSPGDTDTRERPTSPQPRPIRAADFAREMMEPVPGSAATGQYPGAPRPISPEEALFGVARDRHDFGPFEAETPGQDNKDDNRPEPLTPVGESDVSYRGRPSADAVPSRDQAVANVQKEADISFMGRGEADAWDKEKP